MKILSEKICFYAWKDSLNNASHFCSSWRQTSFIHRLLYLSKPEWPRISERRVTPANEYPFPVCFRHCGCFVMSAWVDGLTYTATPNPVPLADWIGIFLLALSVQSQTINFLGNGSKTECHSNDPSATAGRYWRNTIARWTKYTVVIM